MHSIRIVLKRLDKASYMKYNYFILLGIFLFSISCEKAKQGDLAVTNSSGQIEYLPPLWKIPLFEDDDVSIFKPALFGNWGFGEQALIIRAKKGNLPITLTSVDIEDGSVNWEWNGWFNPETELTDGIYYFLNDNILHWKTGSRQYWIDLSDGSTIKKINGDQTFTKNMNTLGDKYFWNGINYDSFPGLRIKSIYQGNFFDENPKMVLMPTVDENQTLNDRAADITSAVPIIDGVDTMLIVAWQQVFPNWDFQSYLGLYNLSKKEWVYEKVPLCEINRKGILYQPLKKFNNSVITNVGTSLISYNYLTGEKIWEQDFDHDFSFSGFEISNNILVASCENKVLYGLDANSGQILWTGQGGGTNSDLENRILDGVVYFGGGSSGYFHAVDISNGQTLWKLDPHKYEYNNAKWDWSITVMPNPNGGKGSVIIQNNLNAYCFEAAK